MKKISYILIVLFSVVLFCGHVEAVTLSLNPSSQSILPVGTAILDLEIAGLTDGGPDSLGAFSLDILYDPVILSFTSAVFGPFLGDTDPLAFETDFFVDDLTPGVVSLGETSFLFDFELDELQPASFGLATLSFTGLTAGFSNLVMQNVVLSDALGFVISDRIIENASVSVVPEPATILLLAGGMAGLGVFGRKRFRK